MKNCLWCGKEVNKNRKYCSEKCRANYRKSQSKLICANCGKEVFKLKKKSVKHIFCNHKCQIEFRYKEENLKKDICIICGNEFYKKNSKHVVCSKKCSDRLQKEKKESIYREYTCDNCGKVFSVNYVKKGKHVFCDHKCSIDYASKEGRDNRKCVVCGKDFSCIKHEKTKTCSKECRDKYRSITFVGENSLTYKHDIPRSERYTFCKRCGKEFSTPPRGKGKKSQYCSRKCAKISMPNTLTKPHIKICDMLLKNNIEYEIEYEVDKYALDISVLNNSYFIEVMGAFWHTDVRNYDSPKWNKQIHIIEKDRRKKETVFLKTGINILYIWEDDINKNPVLCEELILEYINKNGNLKNYHSMNYSVENGKLQLNQNLLFPFFEQ
ncbi:MAG: DUF2116 family Zn-ribbon domain-containing protein [Candidatus Paceibacterota bacterium]